ncbi:MULTISPECIES: D-alanine:D-lactate ligase-like protein [unclassified Mesorhizobium]|uniref:D-alanine:D-lactate ligase-like protein n=1 Tax=unclassified Mesorhizobium TaxID=325217 RepID=UPI0033376629
MPRPTLILVHEPERACLDRLVADGFPAERALEISSYLAQSTDLAPEFDQLATACEKRGLAFMPVALDDAASALAKADPATTLVWTLTDGIAYFRGAAAPALARLNGLRTIGADDALFALCQDKFRSGAVLCALGLPAPQAGLARDGRWLADPPASEAGWFVKPNRLGSKVGIWPDSRCSDLAHALELSRRVYAAYRDDVVVQPYVGGRNVRASFLGLHTDAGAEALGIAFVDSGGDFQTMADSMALYGDTGEAAKAAGLYSEPVLEPVADTQPAAAATIRRIAERLVSWLGLRDVFSLDFRVEANDHVHLIEFEVCPGLPCFDFRAYCLMQWGMTLADAVAETAANRLNRQAI